MSYSGGGGPHVWVPRRLSGLGSPPPDGKYLIDRTIGTTDAGAYAKTVAAGAQGYLSQQATDLARSTFRQNTGIDVPWIPTKTSQVGPWAKQQYNAWKSTAITEGIKVGRQVYSDKMGIGAPISSLLTESEIGDWGLRYLAGHPDLLTNPTTAGAMAMAQAFVMTNSDALGLPPEFIAAAGLIENFPSTVENAEQWGITLASAYLSRFGFPIVTSTDPSAFLSSCGRAAIAQVGPGIPFALCEATYGSLSNGSINFAEAEGLVIGACAWIGGAVGQAFGIPAPIGAMLSQIIASAIVPIMAEALGFGPSDSEKLNAAQVAAAKAAAAATVVCTDLARALWLQYQHYWESMEGNIQELYNANAEWLYPNGCSSTNGSGLRVFPETIPGANTLDIVLDSHGAAIGKPPNFLHYPKPVSRGCKELLGCAYLSYGSIPLARRASYDLSVASLKQGRMPSIRQTTSGCDALSALSFWNARRYVTPYQVLNEMSGGKPWEWLRPNTTVAGQFSSRNDPSWESVLRSDEEYLQAIGVVQVTGGAGQSVGQCWTPKWGDYLSGSLRQAAAASALVQRDLTRTVSSVTTQYQLQKELAVTDQRAAVRTATAKAASFRSAIQEAKRRGARRSDMLNYSLLAAGGAALAGWAIARRR